MKQVLYAWSSRRCLGLVLFYVNRYIPIVDTLILFHIRNAYFRTSELCHAVSIVRILLVIISSNAAHFIIYLQTRAIWGNNRTVNTVLLSLLMIKFAATLALCHFQMSTTIWIVRPGLRGCDAEPTTAYSSYLHITVFLNEVVTIGLTLTKAFEHIRRSRSAWLMQIYRNGILYSVFVLVLALSNAVVIHIKSFDQPPLGLLVPAQHALESVLCSRIILLILKGQRRSNSQDIGSSRAFTLTETESMELSTSPQNESLSNWSMGHRA
ncbi:hypothetical protein CC2G_005051 [Coprinopsis cinerea AmutBmut pab1-1]|nr:hypothetical protein CC2G_005051 [Coprinopsis cinerea AmutBmut pab1-1]